ncbi:MAG: ATP-binding protein [Candidatus Cloacimonetes bacterium]|nr:ATP-binding protein [Candidatus Cloacimonadota bacterium]
MSADLQSSSLKNISESKLCEYMGTDKLIEKVTFEAKRATGKSGNGQVPADFYPTYSGMANTLGGTVVFGLEEIHTKEGETRFKVAGIKNPEKVIDQLFSTLNNRSKVSLNLITNDHIKIVPVLDTSIIKITIPRAEREQKPIYLNQNPINHTYIRNGSGDNLAREEDVRLMIREASTQTTDAEILKHYTIDDLNPQSVLAYRNLFRITSPSHPWNELNDEEFLQRIKALNKDRSKNLSGITKAGLLMFGSDQIITDHFPYYHLDYLEKHSDNPKIRYDNKISSGQGTWSGNIFDFFREVNRKLLQNLDVPFRLRGRQRIDEPAYSEVLREALVNSLIHADYTGSAPVKIENYPEIFVFTNPGDMRRPLALAKEGGISDCRNRILQSMFNHIGYGDQEGFGIVTIYEKWKQQTGDEPAYTESSHPVMTTLTLKRNPVLLKGEAEPIKVKLETLKGEVEPLKVKPETLKGEASEKDKLLTLLSNETKIRINEVGKRTNPEFMKEIIREICSQEDFTLDELCIILGRKNRTTLYDNYIKKMLNEKKLIKTNPDKPTSPNQKYKTVLSQKEKSK